MAFENANGRVPVYVLKLRKLSIGTPP
jgi:hypothetical protein